MGQIKGKQFCFFKQMMFLAVHMKRLIAVQGIGDFRRNGIGIGRGIIRFGTAVDINGKDTGMAVCYGCEELSHFRLQRTMETAPVDAVNNDIGLIDGFIDIRSFQYQRCIKHRKSISRFDCLTGTIHGAYTYMHVSEMAGHDKPIPAVIAFAAENQNGFMTIAFLTHCFSRLCAGFFHERSDTET